MAVKNIDPEGSKYLTQTLKKKKKPLSFPGTHFLPSTYISMLPQNKVKIERTRGIIMGKNCLSSQNIHYKNQPVIKRARNKITAIIIIAITTAIANNVDDSNENELCTQSFTTKGPKSQRCIINFYVHSTYITIPGRV